VSAAQSPMRCRCCLSTSGSYRGGSSDRIGRKSAWILDQSSRCTISAVDDIDVSRARAMPRAVMQVNCFVHDAASQ